MKLALYLTVCVFTTVHSVVGHITEVEDRFTVMEKRFNEMQQNYEDIATRMQTMEMNNGDMATSLKTMQQQIDELQSENSELRNQIQELGAEAPRSAVISFTAEMTSGQFIPPGGEDIIPFDTAISNPGGHYDITTYKFICPSDSMYFFTFSLYSGLLQAGTDHESCSGRLVMDGAMIVEAYARNFDANLQDIKQVSNSAVVFCTKDSEVYVTAPNVNTGIWGSSSTPRTNFSGFIL